MKDKQFKTKTYVDNPPVKDNITKTSFQMRFSKNNFMFIGKWIIAFVLVVVLGSQALNGFISSKFTKDSTTETIVHEYKKKVGSELIGGNFDFVNSLEDLQLLLDKKIYIKYYNTIEETGLTFDSFPINYSSSFINLNVVTPYGNKYIYYYDDDGNLESSFSTATSSSTIKFGGLAWYSSSYSISLLNSSGANYYSYYSYKNNSVRHFFDYSYFVLPSQYWAFESINSNLDFSHIRLFLNTFFTYGEIEERPIYETTTYTYEVKDNNYNWDNKLKQLSKFKPLFNTKDLFVNEEFYEYANLITYEFKNTDIEKENVVNKYKSDERLTILFDNESISIKGREYNFHLIKDKKDYISYIYFDYEKLDLLDTNVYNAYMYALENYVSSVNIDNYFTYSKMNFEPKDLLTIMSFPIQIVLNTLYNFGVLVGFITWW